MSYVYRAIKLLHVENEAVYVGLHLQKKWWMVHMHSAHVTQSGINLMCH